MKKLLFFRSSSASSTGSNEVPSSKTEKQDRIEHPPHIGTDKNGSQTSPKTIEMPSSAESSPSYPDSPEHSYTSSTYVSTKVLDRYIDDGEQQEESSKPQNTSPPGHYPEHGRGRRPLRGRGPATTSLKYVTDEKPMSNPSEEFPSSNRNYHFSAKYGENGIGHESPGTMAKNAIENCMPITVKDILDISSSERYGPKVDVITQNFYSVHEPLEGIHTNNMEKSGLDRHNLINHSGVLNLVETEEDMDGELKRRIKVAKERVVLFREEGEWESSLQQRTAVSGLIQTIRRTSEEKMSLALEVLSLLQSQTTEKASTKEELRLANEILGREKNELQSELEKELDRRSNDWSLKLEKNQLEEQRLRERVRELAEQNVALQREATLIKEREKDCRIQISNSERKVEDLTIIMDKLREENQDLMQNFSELQDKYKIAKEDRDSFKRNFEEKDKECTELYKATTRLTRTCCDQQKTINGLQEKFAPELGKNTEIERFDKNVAKLKMEQIRLSGVELKLRKELESCRFEIDSLRHENTNIFKRLKDSKKDNGALTIKLDEEMLARVDCLQHQGLTLLNESSQLCAELLEFIKERVESMRATEVVKNNLDGLHLIESEMKVEALKRGAEGLKRSLKIASSLLHKKPNLNADGLLHINCDASEHVLKSELKAELLLTSLLKEKLYSKELEIEQLQAEIATASRANHILRCQVQNAQHNISCFTHLQKDLELQILKRNENVKQLENELEDCNVELAIIKGTVAKISEERDIIWDRVKQYSEENMLQNSEVNQLKKKIESMEEDILVREGQITILKDSITNKSFHLLDNIESTPTFLIQ